MKVGTVKQALSMVKFHPLHGMLLLMQKKFVQLDTTAPQESRLLAHLNIRIRLVKMPASLAPLVTSAQLSY